VLGGQAGGWRLGLGVLRNRGVAAWLAAWDALPAPAPAQPPGPPARPVPGSSEQLVAALAAMALSCLAARG
jgi:predicted MFS family arabinose efflux permease